MVVVVVVVVPLEDDPQAASRPPVVARAPAPAAILRKSRLETSPALLPAGRFVTLLIPFPHFVLRHGNEPVRALSRERRRFSSLDGRGSKPVSYTHLIFTSSGLGVFGIYGAGVYGAAKGGVFGLLSILRLEGERYGIRVNAVAPMARTRMSGDDLYSEIPADWASPDLVAPVVAYFASDECQVNGELWSVGAGSVSRVFLSLIHI